MTVQINVWEQNLIKGLLKSGSPVPGHASLSVRADNDGPEKAYISWWPTSHDNLLIGKSVPREAVSSYDQDVKKENKVADYRFSAHGLDENKMINWWKQFKKENHTYNLYTKNCSHVVWKALMAGGAQIRLSVPKQVNTPLILTPWDIAQRAEDIGTRFYGINPWKFNVESLGTGSWPHSPAMAFADDKLYINQGKKIYAVDPMNGKVNELAYGSWSDQVTMASIGKKLYATQGGHLYNVDLATGKPKRVGDSSWTKVQAMTSNQKSLFIIQGKTLYRLDPSKDGGAPEKLKGSWPHSPAMTFVGETLYVNQGKSLYKVDPKSQEITEIAGSRWSGDVTMASIENNIYATQGGHLYSIDSKSADHKPEKLGGSWPKTQAMASYKDYLFVIQGETLYTVRHNREYKPQIVSQGDGNTKPTDL